MSASNDGNDTRNSAEVARVKFTPCFFRSCLEAHWVMDRVREEVAQSASDMTTFGLMVELQSHGAATSRLSLTTAKET